MALLIQCGVCHVQTSLIPGKIIADVNGESIAAIVKNMTKAQRQLALREMTAADLAPAFDTMFSNCLATLDKDRILSVARALPAWAIRAVASEVGNAVNDRAANVLTGKLESRGADGAATQPER